MADRTIVYVDGFNLYYGAVRGGAHKWLNLQRFFSLLRPHDSISQIHYFTALVDGPTRPNQEVYLRALGTLLGTGATDVAKKWSRGRGSSRQETDSLKPTEYPDRKQNAP